MRKLAALVLKLFALGALVAATATWRHVRIRDFLTLVYDSLLKKLPKRLRKHEWRVRSSLLQLYFDSPAVHYEVWVQHKTRALEIGLHFEGEQEENYRWAAALAPRALEIQAQLGSNVELEEWTRRWTRLHETRPLDPDPRRPVSASLTPQVAQETAERLARYIEVLEPILAEEREGAAG